MSRPSFLAITALTLSVCTCAFAHHGNAAYDESKPLTLKGVVTAFSWSNPHSLIEFDAKDGKGKVEHWTIETLSPPKLARVGWTKDAVKAGDQVTITFSPAKSGARAGFLKSIVFLDGKQLGMLEHPQ